MINQPDQSLAPSPPVTVGTVWIGKEIPWGHRVSCRVLVEAFGVRGWVGAGSERSNESCGHLRREAAGMHATSHWPYRDMSIVYREFGSRARRAGDYAVGLVGSGCAVLGSAWTIGDGAGSD